MTKGELMRQTKIVATIGPATDSPANLVRLLELGVNVVRLNFSHGTYDEYRSIVRTVRAYAKKTGRQVAVMQDLQGPKVRVGEMAGDTVLLNGSTVTMTTETVIGDANLIPLDYKGLPKDVSKGDTILLVDGLLELRVLATTPKTITAKVIHGGKLGSHKGINVPSASLSLPSVTPKDARDLKFGAALGVDFVALSFVTSGADILGLRRRLKRWKSNAKIIAKIEKHEAVDNIAEIIQVTDAVMVARGDLGVEIDPTDVPLVQKEIIHACNRAFKPVITATQMLESMISQPRATRAEVSDVANAILDGSDAVMLSAETATGAYPFAAVETMARTAENVEQFFLEHPFRGQRISSHKITTEAVSIAACEVANDVDAKLIVVPTYSGWSAIAVARHRVRRSVVALTENEAVARELCLTWGVRPFVVGPYRNVDQMQRIARRFVLDHKLAKRGEKFVLTAGVPLHEPGKTNMLQVLTV